MREDDPIESPSRKRLLADPKPKQGSASSSSATAAAAPSDFSNRKKTRDLPNLSDCHSCGLHVNSTNPKDKLQTLGSVWRIVLLCRSCLNSVESAKSCSYCFSEADSDSDADCYRCRDCDRRIHKDCVVRYRCSAPWSYCCSGLGFSVCVDCWVPKPLENSIRVYNRRRRGRNKTDVLEPRPARDSRVSGSLKVVVSDAKRAVENKTAVADKAKEIALRKAVVARRAAELANGALELISKRGDNGIKNGSSVASSSCSSSAYVVDSELAFQLHRAMNSSPRISRNLCLMNSSFLGVPRVQESSDNNSSVLSSGSRGSPNPSVCGKIEECFDNKINENTDVSVSKPKVYVRRLNRGPRVSLGSLKTGGLVYSRRCKKDKKYREKYGRSWIFDSWTCHKKEDLEYELRPDDTRTQNRLNSDGSTTMLHDQRCNGKLDRYMLKYSKRSVCSKAISNHEMKTLYGNSNSERNSRAMVVGLHPNSSEECRTLSDTSFQSSAVTLQTSACARDESRDPS